MRVYLFDIDGTLVSTGGAGKAAIETALLAEFGLSSLRGQVPYSGRTDRAIARDLFHLHAIEDAPRNWDRLREGYLQRLPNCLTRHPGRVLPGIAELLVHLRGRCDVAVGLLTGNVRDGARLKLGHFDLCHHFTFGGFGDRHFDRDDVAREALAAVHTHCSGPARVEEIWVIGDTPLDVRCARSIGARALAVATGIHRREELEAARPDLLLSDLSDPGPLLDLLDRAVA
jgi:phosphoglycolate phosphatase-like HAD superfamily hydrolase